MAAVRCEEQGGKKMQEMKFLHAEKTEKTPSVLLEENPLLKVSFLLKKLQLPSTRALMSFCCNRLLRLKNSNAFLCLDSA